MSYSTPRLFSDSVSCVLPHLCSEAEPQGPPEDVGAPTESEQLHFSHRGSVWHLT